MKSNMKCTYKNIQNILLKILNYFKVNHRVVVLWSQWKEIYIEFKDIYVTAMTDGKFYSSRNGGFPIGRIIFSSSSYWIRFMFSPSASARYALIGG